MSSSRTRVVCIKAIWFPAAYTGCNGLGSGLGSNVERGFDGMGILCVFCVYDTIGNRCFEKTSFPKITVKCRLTNHLLTKYCLLFNRPNVIRSPFQLAHSVGPSTAHHGMIGHWDGISLAGRWWPDVVCFLGCEILFYFSENIRFGCLKEPSR